MALAAGLRLVWPEAGWFGVDQARDLTWGARIAAGDEYPTVGPAMRNRVYLGALYYYFWSVPFVFSSEPVAAYVYAGLLGVLATALTFEVGRRVGGASAGLAAALVFATMPLAVIDGRVAWAPAAIPVLCAAFLLAVVVLLQRASLGAALVTAVLAALMVQLHLAAAPVLLVAALAILSQARKLGAAGLVGSAFMGFLVALPTLWALTVPTPSSSAAPAGLADTASGRLLDLLLVGRRAISGLSPDPRTWPTWVGLGVGAEAAWITVVLLCALALALRLPLLPRAAPTVAVLGTLLASLLAVFLLPWEAWYYYLDVGLVPAALVVGLVAVTVLGRPGWWLLLAMAAGRTAVLLWWVHTAHAAGFVSVNLDLLRLGGAPPVAPEARARVPGVGTRAVAAEALVTGVGLGPPELWKKAHGPAFSDLDTDNGYFFTRAAPATGGDRSDADVLVTYRGQVPAAWRSALPAPIIAGPLEILRYDPWMKRSRARLVSCGGGAPPARPTATPLDYGSGDLPRSQWPCREPDFLVPFEGVADGTVVRVFARLDGPGRIVSFDVEPVGGARPIVDPPPGLGQGIEITGAAAQVRVRLSLDGPASLDLFELRAAPATSG